MKPILIFYAGLPYGEYSKDEFQLLRCNCDPELYNGGFAYLPDGLRDWAMQPGWYRMDGTPAYKGDITDELRAYVLLLAA